MRHFYKQAAPLALISKHTLRTLAILSKTSCHLCVISWEKVFPYDANSSLYSQSFALAHSRLTVMEAMPSTSAISSTVKPPK